jgi:hypothetical protein
MRLLLTLSLVVAVLSGGAIEVARGQSRSDRRGEMVDGILRALIESQLGREEIERRHGPQHRPPVRQPTTDSPQMRDVRSTLLGFSQESSGLITALRHEERYSPSVRPLLVDAIAVKAASDVLAQKSAQVRSEQLLMDDVQNLDRQWRILSHRLGQTPALGAPSQAHVSRLDGYDQKLCQLCKITPQLDAAATIGLAMALITNLENLQEDVGIDLRDRNDRDAILSEGRTMQVQMEQVAAAVSRGAPRADVVARYQQGYAQWQQFAAKIGSVESESVARNIHRIDQINGQMHELLWLEQSVDRGTLKHLASYLERGVDKLFRFVPVSVLLSTQDPEQGITTAREFRELCRSLSKSSGSNAGMDDLQWDFRLLQVEWQQVRELVGPLGIAGMPQLIARVDWSIEALRESLQIEAVLDRRTIAHLSASIDELSVSLDRDLRRQVGTSRHYSPQLRSQLLAQSHAFHEAAHGLNENVSRGAQPAQLKQYSNGVAENWRQLAPLLSQLNESDRFALGQTYQQVVPQVAKIQILLAY